LDAPRTFDYIFRVLIKRLRLPSQQCFRDRWFSIFIGLLLVHLPLLLCGWASSPAPSHNRAGGPAPPAGADALGRALDGILHRHDDGRVRYVARVMDLRGGRELYGRNVDSPVMPASNGKLAVSAATLDRFGAGYAFATYLAIDGNDLWLIGTGDPGAGDNSIAKKYGGTTMTILDRFVNALQARGIERIAGDLYFYDGAFDDQRVHPSWSQSYLTDWYAAPISGLNFNNNCIDVHVAPATPGEPAALRIIPPTTNVTFRNQSISAAPAARNAVDLEREPHADVFTLTGTVSKAAELKSKPITDPGALFADALRTRLAARGIVIAGNTRRAPLPLGGSIIPPAEKLIAVHATRMTDALARINKNSQNNFAEAFDKMLGRAWRSRQGRAEPGSWQAGEQAVKAFLARNNIDTCGIVIADGSGLSRDNRVTARMITDLLTVMWRHPDGKTYFNSLGVAGSDGSLATRLTDVRGKVFGKTGFIGGVGSLSGYIHTDRGEWLAFSIIYNQIRGEVDPFESLQDDACRLLVHWPHVKTVSSAASTALPTASAAP
jgi:D-alanyl-D-alanine carboxypeptidase/D-alanyl-D-alanine-endopeptidase (penicillin-binding protein 4)